MQRYWDWAQDQFGNGVAGVSVSVLQSDGVTLANIYDATTATSLIANPMTTDVTGYYAFAAPNGTYILQISGTGYATRTTPSFVLYDAVFGTPGTGSVTSVALSAPGIFTVSGSPVTTTGTLALSLAIQAANKIFAGPTSGAAAAPTFRDLHANDIAGLIAIPVTVPSFMTVADATLGPTDTLALGFANQAANKVLAGPTSGAAAAPDFRVLVPADYPTFVASGVNHAQGAVPDPGAVAGTTKFLCEDATWKNPPFKMQFEMDAMLAFPDLTVAGNVALTPTGFGSLTIPANTLKIGSRIQVRMTINAQTSATGTLNSLECKLGGGAFISGAYLDVNQTVNAVDIIWDFLVTSATGYSFFAGSMYCTGSLKTSTMYRLSTTPGTYASFDITANQTITFQYAVTTAAITSANVLRCDILIFNPA